MLTVLKIKNLALVDALTWELGSGLVGVTGETGAGKSIIVGALKLVLGERADRRFLRTGAAQCTVEAVFRLQHREKVNRLLEEAGLDPCEGNELILKRVVSESGDNKQFINCSPATLAVLKRLGGYLVDLHGPHDHQSLLSTERQLEFLDGYASCAAAFQKYADAYNAWKTAEWALRSLKEAEQASAQEIELLRFQVEEIEEADLKPGEVEELEQQYKVSSNSQRLIDAAGDIAELLSEGQGAILSQLAEVQKRMRDLERIDSTVSDWAQGSTTAQIELEELSRNLGDYLEDLEVNPEEVIRLEARIDLVESLKRKYGGTVEAVIRHGEEAQEKLSLIDGRESQLEALEDRLAQTRETLEAMGAKLSQARSKAAPKLAKEIAGHLSELGFRQSEFEVALEPLDEPGALGMEKVEFQFSPNPGEPRKALRVIASSGEMSRVMLAVKNALADQDRIPLLVFDEIDANVGGEIAHAVGRKMAKLGENQQVIAITHMPQVASVAHQHFVVSKEVKGGSTRSSLRPVQGEDRVQEIARMLGGGGKSAVALAESMLKT